MGDERIRSEQQEDVERADGGPEEHARDAIQVTTPGGGGEPVDDEPDEVALDAGTAYSGGPEEQALHIEQREAGGGRVDRPTSGYVEDRTGE
ncbi:hypothetical protein AB0A74_25485 [Saccharothrix sp. NPDC042600]|uniref:hypothetical protein n=1 Tax=Saccharothrix TaxID=2071 RepID=UPI0033E715E9|nr:hypothetical protein GCM10017745_61900 [Saccharothrix mutabilis subsp. capreolus]